MENIIEAIKKHWLIAGAVALVGYWFYKNRG